MGLLGAVLLGSRDWVVAASVAMTLAILLLVIAYVRTAADQRTRLLAGFLKASGFALLVLCLVEPLWSTTRAKPGENLFLILADNSRSMEIQAQRGQTRGEWTRELLIADESPWQVRLAQDFEVRRYLFDARLQNVSGFDGMSFSGPASAIDPVLRTLSQRYASQPLAGILLFTDGSGTGPALSPAELEKLPPIYPVLPPAEDLPADLAITRDSASESVFEDAPIEIQADVRALGLQSKDVVCQLLDEAGNVVSERKRQVEEPDQLLPFRFQARPPKPGLTFYTLRVALQDELESAFAEPPRTREVTSANNSRTIAVNREAEPYRVLYVAGRPNWEYKFLRRAVQVDPQIHLVGFLRIARREAKFDFRGRADESSNPLFRGFKKTGDEETESYDQPVVIRLNTRDEAELRDGFPRDAESLYQYDAVILDDIEAEFFTYDQLSLIERFVSERGGGLMMLGGPDTFRHGGYDRTPVADALPVYLDRPAEAAPQSGHRLQLTREGWLEPWMRLRTTESEEKARLADMPEFLSVSRVDSVKPAARVMATVSADDRTRFPAVVTQPYGRGRVMAVMIGDLWRWRMQQEADAVDDLSKAWRQMSRWLVADIPRRLEASVRRQHSGSHETVTLEIRARDPVYQPQDNANLTVLIRPPAGKPSETTAEPSLEEAGLFEAVFTPRAPGAYRATVAQSDATGETRETSVGWTSDPAAEEFEQIQPDLDRMRSLAEVTGGEVVDAAELAAFVETLSTRDVPVTETSLTPLWHRSWIFLLVLMCLVGEWGIRRVRGLP